MQFYERVSIRRFDGMNTVRSEVIEGLEACIRFRDARKCAAFNPFDRWKKTKSTSRKAS